MSILLFIFYYHKENVVFVISMYDAFIYSTECFLIPGEDFSSVKTSYR